MYREIFGLTYGTLIELSHKKRCKVTLFVGDTGKTLTIPILTSSVKRADASDSLHTGPDREVRTLDPYDRVRGPVGRSEELNVWRDSSDGKRGRSKEHTTVPGDV